MQDLVESRTKSLKYSDLDTHGDVCMEARGQGIEWIKYIRAEDVGRQGKNKKWSNIDTHESGDQSFVLKASNPNTLREKKFQKSVKGY